MPLPTRVAVRSGARAISANEVIPIWMGMMKTTQAIIQAAYQAALSAGDSTSTTITGSTKPGARSASVNAQLGRPTRMISVPRATSATGRKR